MALRRAIATRTGRQPGGRGYAEQPDGFIKVVLDKSADNGDRDDAAMFLWYSDDVRSEEALVQILIDPTESDDLKEAVIESLRSIWNRHGGIAPHLRQRLLEADLPTSTREEIDFTLTESDEPPN